MTAAAPEAAAPPAWFTAALAAPVRVGRVTVDGTSIAYRAWGDNPGRGLVLVHGGAAHARWWDHIAPLLAAGHLVAAVDLSGHGDSGRRAAYSLDGWAEEVAAVAADAGITGQPVIIGHSMGGFVALRAAGMFGRQLRASRHVAQCACFPQAPRHCSRQPTDFQS